jgi:peroxin-3
MNIEKDWAKLQESRKLEKIELRLKKEREQAALLREEQEAMEQLQEESVILVEQPEEEQSIEETTTEQSTEEVTTDEQSTTETTTTTTEVEETKEASPQNMESSISSLATSIQLEEDRPLPAGILDKKEKHLLWEDIKSKSKRKRLTK